MSAQNIVQANILALVAEAIIKLRDDPTYGHRLSDKWLPSSTWVQALKLPNFIDPCFTINERTVGRAMATKFGVDIDNFTTRNASVIYRVKFRAAFYYYVTLHKPVKYPAPLNNAWQDNVLSVARSVLIVPPTMLDHRLMSTRVIPSRAGRKRQAKVKGQKSTQMLLHAWIHCRHLIGAVQKQLNCFTLPDRRSFCNKHFRR